MEPNTVVLADRAIELLALRSLRYRVMDARCDAGLVERADAAWEALRAAEVALEEAIEAAQVEMVEAIREEIEYKPRPP